MMVSVPSAGTEVAWMTPDTVKVLFEVLQAVVSAEMVLMSQFDTISQLAPPAPGCPRLVCVKLMTPSLPE